MVRLNASALAEIAFLGNDVQVDGAWTELTGVDAHNLHGIQHNGGAIGRIAGENSIVELTAGLENADPAMAAAGFDECLERLRALEKIRLAEDMKLRLQERDWHAMMEAEDLALLEQAAAEAEAGQHDAAMMVILGQLEGDPETGEFRLDEGFLRRWSLPLALLCGGHQLNHSLGFLYWMGRRLADEPVELIRREPGLWLAYLHRCAVVGCYDILGDVLRQLQHDAPELARDALVYLFTLRDMKVPAVSVLRGNMAESHLAYFPAGNSRGVYGRYCNAVEQILRGGWLSPLGGNGETYGIIYDYTRLHGYVYAVTSTLRSCFIGKGELKDDMIRTMELKLLQNVSDGSLGRKLRMVENTRAQCRW